MMMEITRGIYGLRCKTTNRWYIGQTINDIKDRWNDYKNLRCDGQLKIYYAILKYGYDDFEKVVVEKLPLDKKLLNERETYWVKHYDSYKNGYNCTEGGDSGWTPMKGKHHTEETKQKIRDARSKQKIEKNHVSREACDRLSLMRKGKSLSEEHRLKLSISHIGSNQLEETKEKISKSLLGIKRGSWTEERRLRKSLSMIGKKLGPRNKKEPTLV